MYLISHIPSERSSWWFHWRLENGMGQFAVPVRNTSQKIVNVSSLSDVPFRKVEWIVRYGVIFNTSSDFVDSNITLLVFEEVPWSSLFSFVLLCLPLFRVNGHILVTDMIRHTAKRLGNRGHSRQTIVEILFSKHLHLLPLPDFSHLFYTPCEENLPAMLILGFVIGPVVLGMYFNYFHK